MKIIWVVFILICIFLFSYVFVYINNPITNIEFYYSDATIDNANNLIKEIQKSYTIYSIYSVFLIKTLIPPEPNKNYCLSMYVTREASVFYVLLISRRFNLHTLNNSTDNLQFEFSDKIVNFHFFRYHVFTIGIGKKSILGSSDIHIDHKLSCPSFEGKLIPNQYMYLKLFGSNLMRFYILQFKKQPSS
jgi:hypothetical protein